jgi:hypothetical protein
MIETYTSPLTAATPWSCVSRLWVAVCRAVNLPELAIDPVLSSTSATRSRWCPQTATDVAAIGILWMPTTPMKSAATVADPPTVTVRPPVAV